MGKLLEIFNYLDYRKNSGKTDYAVPKRWMPENYIGDVKLKGRKFFVNPYEYYTKIIRSMASEENIKNCLSCSLSSAKDEKDPSWLKKSVIYSAHVRMTGAYIHSEKELFKPIDELGYRESGTFLKMIAMLPYLKRYNVNCVYLLPVTQSSNRFKKGEVGSPYAVKDFFKVDRDYHDPLLGENFSADDEFAAFVQACHLMGIRVMLDFVPRTAARDNKLILEHPEWFYWIDTKELSSFKPPWIDTLKFELPTMENIESIYSNASVKNHLKKFRMDPKTQSPEKWGNFIKANIDNDNFLDEIMKEFKVITVPGFSDWINDPQPTWDDVTFSRLYLSHPSAAKKFLDPNQPPYVLFDVVKASNFPGEIKNEELWEKLSDIMPFYQTKYGIDGARLDMGHALPKELEHRIIQKAKDTDPSFVVIAEELNMDNHKKAKESGYDAILGNSWWTMPRYMQRTNDAPKGWMKKFISEMMPNLELPAFATSETPDSPRAVTREGGENFSKLSAVLNSFMPNGITVINSGYEIFEAQPMNTGLDFDNPQEQRFQFLPPVDQFYGKLAFFDWYCLHWDTDHHMVKLLQLLGQTKERVKDLIADPKNFRFLEYGEEAFVMFWWEGKTGVVVPVNLNPSNPYYFEVDIGYFTWRGYHNIDTALENYRRGESHWEVHDGKLRVTVNPSEARVFIVS
ncbi:MAG TPA: alpha-amylase family glycosyl hydrolase [Petrotogaceae bacterium]|nr:alpha-amylase family glycosyl hydrolase [Petrotogaceae bacterium]HOG34601.1 alpha-amylase family glycosyl hydrolase [Petrotogaceae bacterium]HPA93575.1 alpha-amylase family glycosyl hydrolase [Petrotogaceae bacterium]HPO26593.1 alpha-amylase family glycosyl hydrolase [Petrotogaceae bacterium]HPX16436.1 alpha-amylase family glycosyl hydrolase [Petrotogaceae bacterium]